VALWQGLYGERPFAGETLNELVLAVSTGRRREPRAGVRVPSWLRRVVERGLATMPERRFATMTALLSALASGAGRRRRGFVIAGALALGMIVGMGIGARQVLLRQRVAACVAEGASVRALWDAGVRGRLEEALVAAEAGHAGTQALRSLDAFAAGWAGARTVACERVLVEGRWDRDTSERALGCLQAARGALAGALAHLHDGDPRGALRVTQAAASLPALTPCLDARALALRPPLPGDRAAQAELARLELLLERASSLRAAGQVGEGWRLARSLVPRADALGWGPLAARVRLVAGPIAVEAGAPAEAEALLEEGLLLAMRAGEAGLTAEALIGLTRVVGDGLARREEGLRWGRQAAAQLEQIGATRGLLGAAQRASVGEVLLRAGAAVEAEAAFGEALAIYEGELGPEALEVASTLLRVATVQLRRGEVEASRRTGERCLAIRTATLGAEHPEVGAALAFLAKTYHANGDFAEAQRLLERSIALRGRAYGPDAPPMAREYNNLAAVLEARGDYIAAQRFYEWSLAIREGTLPPDHPDLALTMRNLANVYTRRGAYAAGRRLFDRALAISERNEGPESLEVAFILHNMGVLVDSQGEATAALRLYERALQIRELRLGPDAPLVADTLNNLAHVSLRRGDFDAAERLQRRVLAIYERTLPPGHSEFGYPLAGLGDIAFGRGRAAEAVVWLERALRVSQGEGGGGEPGRGGAIRAGASAVGRGARPGAGGGAGPRGDRGVSRGAGDPHARAGRGGGVAAGARAVIGW
jgi:tetratricopeptide (TPR) repeat protein